jgi:hypothetical protein
MNVVNRTVGDIIKVALRKLDIIQLNQAPDSDESNLCLDALNLMLGQWNTEKLMIFGYQNETFNLTPGVGVYSIGDGGDFQTTRPQKIDKAFIRFTPSNAQMAYDFNLEIISNEKYQNIFMKQLQVTYPLYLFYNPTFPLGEITLWPYPNSACQLAICQWQQLVLFTSLAQELSLPPGYDSAIAYNLAVEICPDFGKTPSQVLIQKAVDTKENIMALNLELTPLETDLGLYTPRGFNILSGSYR